MVGNFLLDGRCSSSWRRSHGTRGRFVSRGGVHSSGQYKSGIGSSRVTARSSTAFSSAPNNLIVVRLRPSPSERLKAYREVPWRDQGAVCRSFVRSDLRSINTISVSCRESQKPLLDPRFIDKVLDSVVLAFHSHGPVIDPDMS
jgi:hypothetical protein